MTLDEKDEYRKKQIRLMDKFHLNNCGDYERIYPLTETQIATSEYNQQLMQVYDMLI